MVHTALVMRPVHLLRFNPLACLPHIRSVSSLQSSTTHTLLSSRSSSCRMSSTSSGPIHKKEYLVIVPDHPNSLQKRLAVREQHLENIKPRVQFGDVVFGGSILSRHPNEGDQPDMTGSAMLIRAESEEAVWELIASDVYVKGGAWNLSEAKIYPFRGAIMAPSV